jgi:hypothetical protein
MLLPFVRPWGAKAADRPSRRVGSERKKEYDAGDLPIDLKSLFFPLTIGHGMRPSGLST